MRHDYLIIINSCKYILINRVALVQKPDGHWVVGGKPPQGRWAASPFHR